MRQLKITQQITYREENSIKIYFQDVNKYPMVTVEEEVELAMRIHTGDEIAMQKLVEANLRFVISVAKQYQNQGLSFSDLINEGNAGLVIAARRFDETRGFKFISYAVWWIRQSIMQAISQQTRIVRLPANRISSINRISKAIPQLEQQLEREPTNSEIADFLEINEEQIETNNSIKNHPVSLDKPFSQDGENDGTLYDIVETENLPAPDSKLMSESIRINLHRALKKLNSKEYEVLSLLFGVNDKNPHSIHEIANIMGFSGERVRQIRNLGLLQMKKLMSGKSSFLDNV